MLDVVGFSVVVAGSGICRGVLFVLLVFGMCSWVSAFVPLVFNIQLPQHWISMFCACSGFGRSHPGSKNQCCWHDKLFSPDYIFRMRMRKRLRVVKPTPDRRPAPKQMLCMTEHTLRQAKRCFGFVTTLSQAAIFSAQEPPVQTPQCIQDSKKKQSATKYHDNLRETRCDANT